jgi:hypothetical protein
MPAVPPGVTAVVAGAAGQVLAQHRRIDRRLPSTGAGSVRGVGGLGVSVGLGAGGGGDGWSTPAWTVQPVTAMAAATRTATTVRTGCMALP